MLMMVYSSPLCLRSVPPYFEKMTISPTLSSIGSSLVPGPTARTSACCGFSLALPERSRPASVLSSASIFFITTLAPSGFIPILIFMPPVVVFVCTALSAAAILLALLTSECQSPLLFYSQLRCLSTPKM